MSAILIDVGARLVQWEGVEIHLAPRAFDLLLILVRNQPNVVRHEHLHAALWPGIHVSDTSLPALVTQLRRALGDTSKDGRVIRTLHRVGYSFIGAAVITEGTPHTAEPVCRLIWRRQSFALPAGESVIGRDRTCAVRIDADSVSRHHARLHIQERDVSIEDLGSKNGTWIAGKRVQGTVPLSDGILVRLGSEIVRLEIGIDEKSTKTTTP